MNKETGSRCKRRFWYIPLKPSFSVALVNAFKFAVNCCQVDICLNDTGGPVTKIQYWNSLEGLASTSLFAYVSRKRSKVNE